MYQKTTQRWNSYFTRFCAKQSKWPISLAFHPPPIPANYESHSLRGGGGGDEERRKRIIEKLGDKTENTGWDTVQAKFRYHLLKRSEERYQDRTKICKVSKITLPREEVLTFPELRNRHSHHLLPRRHLTGRRRRREATWSWPGRAEEVAAVGAEKERLVAAVAEETMVQEV